MKEMIKIFTSARVVLLTMVFAIVASINVSYAVRANPEPATVTQPDGSQITIRVHGDEFFNYTTTLDGYIVARNNKGVYCYADYNSGQLRISTTQAGKGFYIGGAKSIPANVQIKMRMDNIDELVGPNTLGTSILDAGFKPPNVLVILVEYPDKPFVISNPQQAFEDMTNLEGYAANGATGSISDFYNDSSFGAYKPTFEVYGPFMMPNSFSSYLPEAEWKRHTEEACRAADAEVDYAKYSANGSEVDLVLIYYSGHNPAEQGVGVWPHRSSIGSRNVILDGKLVTNYVCTSELKGASGANMAGIGTMTHEFAHALGLSDLYNVGNSSNLAMGSWADFNLMNTGNYNNAGRTPPLMSAPQREKLGWLTFEDIDVSTTYTLAPLHSSNKAYRIKTDVENEYYTFENRGTGADNKWDAYIGGKGMLIYHMDYSQNSFTFVQNGTSHQVTAAKMWAANMPNSAPNHQCSDLIEATGYEYSVQNALDLFFPGRLNVTAFGRDTKPAFAAWSGAELGIELTNITLTGDNISFKADVAGVNHSKAQLKGMVRNVIGLPLKNVKVTLYEAAARSNTISGEFYSISTPEKYSSTPIASTETDDIGRFFFMNIEEGKNYLLEFKKDGFNDHTETKKLLSGQNTLAINVLMSADNPDLNVMQWNRTSGTSAIGALGGGFIYAAIKFNPVELRAFEQDKLRSVSVMTDEKATSALLTIRRGAVDNGANEEKGDTLLLNMRMDQPEGGLYVFDLSSLNISKDKTKTLTIIVRTAGAVYLDESLASIANKGDRISTDGKIWRRVADNVKGKDGNWVISVQTGDSDGQTAPYPAIVITDYTVGSRFIPQMRNLSADVESIKYSVNGTTVPSSGYSFSSSGNYTILAEIKYTTASGLGTETITRKINVK